MKPFLVVLPLLGLACATPRDGARSQAVPGAPAAAIQDPRDSIARLEDLRSDGEGLLQALAARGEEETRRRAVRALGRLAREEFGASVSHALEVALDDPSAAVRDAAAFALGLRADPATVEALVAAAHDESASLRERAVEALSRVDDARARRIVIEALDDESSSVRGAAALGIQRFRKDAAEGAAADAALVERVATDDVELRWRALFTLGRRVATGARAAFEADAAADDARVRIFALQGLGALTADANSTPLLVGRLADPDWRVAVEAANALARHASASGVAPLLTASARSLPPHAAHHVRRAAFDALGRIPSAADSIRPALERAREDASASVRAAAIEAAARLFRDDALSSVQDAASNADPVVRAAAAASAAHLSTEAALPLIERLLTDHEMRVATAAADALGAHAGELRARERLRALLAAPDNGLRLSAATALTKDAVEPDLPALERALASTRGEIAAEVAAGVVDAAAKIGGEGGLALLRLAIAHTDPYVARKARAAALALRADPRLPRVAAAPRRDGALPPSRAGTEPRVAIDTTKGRLVFELVPDDAPFHVENLLQLARRGHYDGTPFHRVVPDFVVQGGDRRGDGNGGTTWRGDALRGEFGPRPFRRGSLGMPRNDDPDSGGSQVFVCHRETPHLDGRYTLFGELVEGWDVLDALDVGDRILAVSEVDALR